MSVVSVMTCYNVTGGVCHVSVMISVMFHRSCVWWGSSCVSGGVCHVSLVVSVM